MKLFEDKFKLFFNDLVLQKFKDECLLKSHNAFAIKNGNIPKWTSALDEISAFKKGDLDLNEPYISIKNIGASSDNIEASLKKLLPWRKGPYILNDLKLESEWLGDLKWQRLKNKIKPLHNKRVLDVGAGNGYFTMRMALEGAKQAIGVEPFLLFNFQYAAIDALFKNNLNSILLPLRLEELPNMPVFDSVFSMGVLYHQRDHIEHLSLLKKMMSPESELILETLIVDGPKNFKLTPEGRYANMRNVYCLPSIETLMSWLDDADFKNIEVIDISQTTPTEQRKTSWIGDNPASLEDFLNPSDSSLTIEGYPAPKRAIVICKN
jgi:tRNA (mo5U34)-methyltransferase